MLFNIVSLIANIVYLVVLNLNIYTDRAVLPGGQVREWHRSPAARLELGGQTFLLYLQIVLAAVSIITAVLMLFGVRSRAVKTTWLVAAIASTAVFIIIMIVTSNSHARYA